MVRLKYIIKHKARDIKFKIDVIICFLIIACRAFMRKPNIKYLVGLIKPENHI